MKSLTDLTIKQTQTFITAVLKSACKKEYQELTFSPPQLPYDKDRSSNRNNKNPAINFIAQKTYPAINFIAQKTCIDRINDIEVERPKLTTNTRESKFKTQAEEFVKESVLGEMKFKDILDFVATQVNTEYVFSLPIDIRHIASFHDITLLVQLYFILFRSMKEMHNMKRDMRNRENSHNLDNLKIIEGCITAMAKTISSYFLYLNESKLKFFDGKNLIEKWIKRWNADGPNTTFDSGGIGEYKNIVHTLCWCSNNLFVGFGSTNRALGSDFDSAADMRPFLKAKLEANLKGHPRLDSIVANTEKYRNDIVTKVRETRGRLRYKETVSQGMTGITISDFVREIQKADKNAIIGKPFDGGTTTEPDSEVSGKKSIIRLTNTEDD